MMEYKCSKFGTCMESPNSLGGQHEKCPECGTDNRVPSKLIMDQAYANRRGQYLGAATSSRLVD